MIKENINILLIRNNLKLIFSTKQLVVSLYLEV